MVVICLCSAKMIVALGALPIPAPLLGMLLLFALLQGRIIHVNWVKSASQLLIAYLAFFFIPVGVGVINYLNLLAGNVLLIAMLLVCLPTAAILAVGKFASKGRYRD
ncbi:CidA/LrgA family protein [Pseudoalteromonas luteoviolacea]|nr:CidA/LrgA family protein [Pseudoalteromonas luteoviolacea]